MQHSMHVLDQTGDTVMTFDPTDEVEVAKVRAEFDRLVGEEKQLAYTVSASGESEVTREFVAEAPQTIVTRQMVGG
jgi:hypothetical protein